MSGPTFKLIYQHHYYHYYKTSINHWEAMRQLAKINQTVNLSLLGSTVKPSGHNLNMDLQSTFLHVIKYKTQRNANVNVHAKQSVYFNKGHVTIEATIIIQLQSTRSNSKWFKLTESPFWSLLTTKTKKKRKKRAYPTNIVTQNYTKQFAKCRKNVVRTQFYDYV